MMNKEETADVMMVIGLFALILAALTGGLYAGMKSQERYNTVEYWTQQIPECDNTFTHFEVKPQYSSNIQYIIKAFTKQGYHDVVVDRKKTWTEVEGTC